MSSSMSAMRFEDGVMVKISIEPVFSNKPTAAGESAEEVKKVVKWIDDVDCEIKKMKVFPKEFAMSINLLCLLMNLMKKETKIYRNQLLRTTQFVHKTFSHWKEYFEETELTLQNSVTSVQNHIDSQQSSKEKSHSLFKDVSAVNPNSKKVKEKEIMVMPTDLSLSSSFCVENSCSIPWLQQRQRKTRRSWSRDLHEQFLVAVKQLGGPQTATPKQIREVMKVSGLTNDEVKSHLQKYRLYSRKNAKASHIVDLSLSLYGGVPQEYYATWNQAACMTPESPLEFEKVRDELSFKEKLGDSGKDVGSKALTFLVNGT